jgi:plastocyanin
MPRLIHLALLAGVLTPLAAVAAPSPAREPKGAAAAAAVTAATVTHKVRMGEYFYRPKTVTIAVGDRVRFRNTGEITHTVADTNRRGRIRGRLIKPRPIDPGESQTVRFTKPGTVRYLCTFHPKLMGGVIIVR